MKKQIKKETTKKQTIDQLLNEHIICVKDYPIKGVLFRDLTPVLANSRLFTQAIDGLITNFQQPKSTLLLLVSALIGDAWRQCYRYALDHEFRFLSYGDSCLFFP